MVSHRSLARVLAPLALAFCLAACGEAGSAGTSPDATATPVASASAPEPTPSPTPTPTPTPTPSPLATASPARADLAWTTKAVEVRSKPGDGGVEVHLGSNFPLVVTSEPTVVAGKTYVEAVWNTLLRMGRGWVPADGLVFEPPKGSPSAGVDALDPDLQAYLTKLGTRVGVQVLDVTREMTYSYNATKGFYAASSIKVPIMMTFLYLMERGRREPTAHEMSLLTSMIEQSNNDSATALYRQIGAPKSIKSYMQRLGVTGVTPSPGTVPFGLSPISPAGMVALLDKLRSGTALNKVHTELALKLMSHVAKGQQIGVGDTRPPGASVAMKDGWYAFGKGYGTVMNSSGIVTTSRETYIISVYTDNDHGVNDGFVIARHVCSAIAKLMVQPIRPFG